MKLRDKIRELDFWKILDNVIYQSHILLEIADARMPELTRNKRIEDEIEKSKKVFILVLNKSDLITRKMRDDFLMNSNLERVVFVSCKNKSDISHLKRMIWDISKKMPHWKEVRIGVVGYPNTGKSSVINALTGRYTARTSSVAGLTRGIQWIKGNGNLLYLDSPGTIPLKDKDEIEKGLMSAIDPSKIKRPDLVAAKIIELFLKNRKDVLEKFYGVKIETDDPLEIILDIGRRKNFLGKGGKIDESRTSVAIINDWQKGKLLLNSEIM